LIKVSSTLLVRGKVTIKEPWAESRWMITKGEFEPDGACSSHERGAGISHLARGALGFEYPDSRLSPRHREQ